MIDPITKQILIKEKLIAMLPDKNVDFINEAFEFIGYIGVIEHQIRGTYGQCMRIKCHKSSGGTGNQFKNEGRRCANLCWAEAFQKAIKSANLGKNRCKTAKNPDKCRARFDKAINVYKDRIAKHKEKASKQ